jgi:SdrD B-like domain/Secretion system C-terminal sorting domain
LGDNFSSIAVDYSNDGGATWSVIWQQSSGQIYSWIGPNTVKDIWLAIPSTYLTANFKYRFRLHKYANSASTFNPFVDDVTVFAYSCGDLMNLGNLVWMDTNLNGIKDAAEQGVPGVGLELLRDNDADGINDWDFTPQVTTTDINGNYQFTNLTAGKYFVSLVGVNTIYRVVTTNAGEPDEDGDNNNNGLTQTSDYTIVKGGWITLLPQSEPTNDGDGNNGNLSFDFAIYPASLLPVNSITLNLFYNSGETTVNWKTFAETNLLMFDVERSTDNIKFEKIATKTPTASYGGNASYTVTDITGSNFATTVYYRIKIIDKDLKFRYSKTEVVKIKATENKISVWPNPFVNQITISQTVPQASQLFIKITDNTGRVVKTQSFKAAAGLNQIAIDNLENLSAGVYAVSVYSSADNSTSVYKIIK